MSAASRRGSNLERKAAKALGSKRVLRAIGESAGDIECVRLPCGLELSAECKKRESLPALIRGAMDQARRYLPNAIPCAILAGFGEQPVIVLPLSAFREIAGLAPSEAPTQPSLFARGVL